MSSLKEKHTMTAALGNAARPARLVVVLPLLVVLFFASSLCRAQAAGSKIAFSSDRDGNSEIYVMNADGSSQQNLTNHPASDSGAAWSPDGTKIAFASNRDGNFEVYVIDADGSNPFNLTNNSANEATPAWSPDGSMIAFRSDRDGDMDIYVMAADGSGPITNLTNHPSFDHDPTWSPDGTQIAFSSDRTGVDQIFVMNTDGSSQMNITNSAGHDGQPDWSPDGATIAFTKGDPSGVAYLIDPDGSNLRLLGPTGLSGDPSWSPDGTQLAIIIVVGGRDDIFAINADGTGLTNLTNNPAVDAQPAWSPFLSNPSVLTCIGFDPPMDSGPVTVRGGNRALPLKGELFDDALEMTALDLTAPPVIQILFESVLGGGTVDITSDALPAGQGTDGNQFVYSGGKWQFNLLVKDLTAPGTYTITMESGDEDEYMIDPTCEAQFVVE
jgi:Tol biopolymer transport system component